MQVFAVLVCLSHYWELEQVSFFAPLVAGEGGAITAHTHYSFRRTHWQLPQELEVAIKTQTLS